jgi:hypothetical protein
MFLKKRLLQKKQAYPLPSQRHACRIEYPGGWFAVYNAPIGVFVDPDQSLFHRGRDNVIFRRKEDGRWPRA